jgi:hypothetical protein
VYESIYSVSKIIPLCVNVSIVDPNVYLVDSVDGIMLIMSFIITVHVLGNY